MNTYTRVDLTKKKLHLKSIAGCGTGLYGRVSLNDKKAFREIIIRDRGPMLPSDTSEVEYKFFSILYLPIIPLGCYRIQQLHRAENSFETIVYYDVEKKEKPSWKELFHIYLSHFAILLVVVLSVIHLLSEGSK